MFGRSEKRNGTPSWTCKCDWSLHCYDWWTCIGNVRIIRGNPSFIEFRNEKNIEFEMPKKSLVMTFYRLIAACEFLYGTKKQAEEMGSSWLEEIKEEFLFAVLCQGDTKV